MLTFTILRILTIYFHDVQWWSVVDALKVIKNYHLRLNLTTSMGFSSTNGNCRHKISSFSGVLLKQTSEKYNITKHLKNAPKSRERTYFNETFLRLASNYRDPTQIK